MSQVKVTNKKSGITYVYESESYWDKEKKQPRNKRKLIGKIDPEDTVFQLYIFSGNFLKIAPDIARKFHVLPPRLLRIKFIHRMNSR